MEQQKKNYDIFLTQLGKHTIFDIVSTEALVEFESLIPNKIDRDDHIGGSAVGNIGKESLAVTESTKECIERRKEIVKTIGINQISRYIPLMIETTDEWAKSVKRNDLIQISLESAKIVFRVFSKIILGSDVENIPPILYTSPTTGETQNLPLVEFYFRYLKDEFDASFNPKGAIFPFLESFALSEPFKSNLKNNKSYFDALREFIKMTKDTESVYKRLESQGKFDQDTLLKDTSLLLFAGFDTTSRLISSCLYFLKKNPAVLEKLKEAMFTSGITNIEEKNSSELKDIYENCDYLNYVTINCLFVIKKDN